MFRSLGNFRKCQTDFVIALRLPHRAYVHPDQQTQDDLTQLRSLLLDTRPRTRCLLMLSVWRTTPFPAARHAGVRSGNRRCHWLGLAHPPPCTWPTAARDEQPHNYPLS
jgi:hypothetical protein